MNIGILVEVEEGLDWDSWRRVYTTAERLGFESVWLSDHLRSPWFGGRSGLETWTALSVAAAETQRLVLGPLVSPVTFREPAIVARMAAGLAQLTTGRLVVGLGMGWNIDEHRASGIPFGNLAHRRQRLIETVERIRCECDARVLIGGRGPSVLPVVAGYADEWNVTTASASEFTLASEQLDALCGEIGRGPAEIRRSVATGVLVARDQVDLEQRADRMHQCVPPITGLEAAREMGWIVGTVADVRRKIGELQAAGVDRVIFGHYDLADDQTLEMLAEVLL